MSDFVLHPQLAKDTLPVAEWQLSRVLRMNDTTYPWLILVPRRANCREISELTSTDRHRLIDEIARASEALQREFRPEKINVGALGNMVPQLHIHVIARFVNDPAWPKPVWGVKPPTLFTVADAKAEIIRWHNAFNLPAGSEAGDQ
ncbi:MAG TPA: HIT family protein [Dongiaceae bacterium]|nr:HIT family protein [Dongiaceae bacterium]